MRWIAARAAALSDQIDPTRRGQEATAPPVGALTVSESQSVTLTYPGLPVPDTHFDVDVGARWRYQRHTTRPGETIKLFGLILPEVCAPDDGGPVIDLTAADVAALAGRRGPIPGSLSSAVTRPPAQEEEPAAQISVRRCPCGSFQATALLTPVPVDRAFPVVLREPVRSLYRFKTWCRGRDLRFGQTGRLRQDRGLCAFGCPT
jgi:hypothetical protein